jgi:catechol 2,3-dioxygenase-like lactoylglutathione lyase family enzyme
MIKKIDHVAVIVKDIDEAVESYSSMFGFKIVREMEGPGGEFKSAMISAGISCSNFSSR